MHSEPHGVFLAETSDINRSLTQSLFVNEQFLIDHAAQLNDNPEVLTSDHFSSNPYRRQFNWALGKLGDERSVLESFLFRSTFVFVHSAYDVYTEKLYSFVRTAQELDRQGGNESQLSATFSSLGTSAEAELPPEALLTLDYLRWRRNRLVHNDGSPSQQLSSLIKNHGARLDEFWSDTLNGLPSLSFTDLSTTDFTQDETIDLIRVFRRLADQVDEAVLAKLGTTALLDFLRREFIAHHGAKLNGWDRERQLRKFRGYALTRLKLEVPPQQIEEIDFSGV